MSAKETTDEAGEFRLNPPVSPFNCIMNFVFRQGQVYSLVRMTEDCTFELVVIHPLCI